MEKDQLINSILRTVKQELEIFLEEEPGIRCPMEYEKRLIELGRKHSLEVLLQSRGKRPKSRNLKKR